jgi:hypothetical protein
MMSSLGRARGRAKADTQQLTADRRWPVAVQERPDYSRTGGLIPTAIQPAGLPAVLPQGVFQDMIPRARPPAKQRVIGVSLFIDATSMLY